MYRSNISSFNLSFIVNKFGIFHKIAENKGYARHFSSSMRSGLFEIVHTRNPKTCPTAIKFIGLLNVHLLFSFTQNVIKEHNWSINLATYY